MGKQSISLFTLKSIFSFFIIVSIVCCDPARVYGANPTLKSLQAKFRQAQAKSDYKEIAKILRQMLDAGYKSVERYKQLGDLYFYIKQDKAALDTFREQAKWANTSKTWENLSDLLIWKKHNDEGLKALETAYKLDKNNQKLQSKLASKYEYFKKTQKAESIFKSQYLKNNKSIESGHQLIEFYLRNSLVARAKGVMDELLHKYPDLSNSTKLKILNIKINSWLSKPSEASAALNRMNVDELPKADLDHYFDMALYGGNIEFAEKILKRLDSLGKDVWMKQLEIKKTLGIPKETRKLIDERIDDTDESPELLFALYETYRAERDIENEIETLEDLIEIDPLNENWHNMLLQHYNYSQKLEQGIDVFEDLLDDNEESPLIRFNLAKLYLANQDFENFNTIITTVKDKKYQSAALDLRISAAYQQDNKQIISDTLKEVLKQTRNIPPEELVKPGYKGELPDDRYLDLLSELGYLAEELGNNSEKIKYNKAAYGVLKSRYNKYPTDKRLRLILELGEEYADKKEREDDLAVGEKKFSDVPFLLKKYRHLMKQGKYEEAEQVLTNMLALAKNLEDSVQVAEHTFGFVSYNFSKKLFGDIIARDPNYTMGLKRLGQIGLYTDNYQEAIFYMSKYLTVNSYDPEAVFNLGEALYYSHQPYAAEDQFERVITLLDYPGLPTYESLLAAISHLRLEDYEKALNLLQDALKKNPTDLSIKLNILETLVLQKKWKEALELIETENLDDERKKQRARELVFKANIDTENTKEDSEFKVKLKFEELKAIVDLQLALRVNIIRHFCLEGLGREKEDRALLEGLAEKHPGNQEVISTLGYFYLERAEDDKAIKYLGIARNIPPYDPILNQSHRRVTKQYTSSGGVSVEQYNSSSDGQQENAQQTIKIDGKLMLNALDKLVFEVVSFSSKRFADDSSTTEDESATAMSYGIGYNANISSTFDMALTHNYEVQLWSQDLTGYELKYLVTFHNPAVKLDVSLFSDLPDSIDFDRTKGKSHKSGYGINSTIPWKSMKQEYAISYVSNTVRFANDDFEGEPAQTLLTLSGTQSLMDYPSNLSLNLLYATNDAAGEASEFDGDTATTTYRHLNLPYTQLQLSMIFSRHWSEFFSNIFSINYSSTDYGEFKTDNKTTNGYNVTGNTLGIEFNYLKETSSYSGYINYTQEGTGEKTEITTDGAGSTESVADAKESTVMILGISASILF